MPASRSNVVSSFTIVKGSMIEETHAVFTAWDFGRGKRENLDHLRHSNFIRAKSDTWLRDVAKVINRRFDPAGRDRPLVLLAKAGWPLEDWKPLLLWHIRRVAVQGDVASTRASVTGSVPSRQWSRPRCQGPARRRR
jgi:hypothetical protein